MNNNASTKGTSAFSIEAWVKTAGTSSSTRYIYQEDQGGVASSRTNLYVVGNTEKIALSVRPVDGSSTSGLTLTTSDTALVPGNWYHVAAVWSTNGTTIVSKVYINGVETIGDPTVYSLASISNTAPYNGVNYIGGGRNGLGLFNGQIDEVRISNTARSAADIQNYYNASNPQPISATTLTATPTITTPTTPQNNLKPTISGTGATPSTEVRLYDNGTQKASVTADGSGNFTFNGSTPAYADFTQGEHSNVTVRGYNASGETADSAAVTIFIDTTAPSAPNARTAAKVTDSDGADITDNDWNGHNNGSTVYFAWSGASDPGFIDTPQTGTGIKRYWVYFGPNAGAVPRTDGQATANSTLNVAKTLSSPVSGTDYYFRIQTEDNAGNISSDGSIPTLFTYKFDNTAPSVPTTISHTPVGWSVTNSFGFTWDNWTEAHSGFAHYLYNRKTSATEDTYESFDTTNRKITDVTNPVNATGIEALFTGINYIRVFAVDRAGNVSGVYAQDFYFYSGNIPGPTIVPNPNTNTTNSFGFTLTKPGGVTPIGYYCGVESSIDYTNSAFIDLSNPPASISVNGKTTNITINGDEVTLSPFAAATQAGINYIYCATKDNSGNIGWGTKSTSDPFTINTTPPAIPDNISITDASDRGEGIWALTVAWSPLSSPNSDFAGYKIFRCVDADCSNNANYSEVATVTTNIYSEAGLDNTKDYYYKIKSVDNVGIASEYTDAVHKIPTGKFTTPPEYTSNPAAETKATSVKVSWTTNRPSNSIVQYGTTTNYGQEASKSTENVTDHEIEILGLAPGTTYHFRVQSLDADRDYDPDSAYSADYSFTTSQAPGISDVAVSEIRLTTAIITWKTTSSSTSKILYGTSTAYGSTYTDSSASQTTTHTVRLEKLSDATTYNFKIQGTDIEGNVLNSDNYVFTTLTYPRISNLKVAQVPNTPTSTIKVNFDSNVPTTSQVVVSGTGGKEAATYELKNSHEITISGLRDNTFYTVTAKGRDQYGNEASPATDTYQTEFDTRPPAISDITIETSIVGFGAEAKGQVLVSWTTDEPSTSQIEYAPGASGNEYAAKTQEDSGLVTNHVVIISDLKTSSPYHFRIVSKDGAENVGRSEDNSVLTEQANESVIDLIIKSLQSTIGWIFGVFAS